MTKSKVVIWRASLRSIILIVKGAPYIDFIDPTSSNPPTNFMISQYLFSTNCFNLAFDIVLVYICR